MTKGMLAAAICALALACGGTDTQVDPVDVQARAVAAAVYDPVLKAPACAAPAEACDAGTLLVGRGPRGPESNTPNVIGGTCADGASGTFHGDESLDQLRVTTLDGAPLAPGKQVRVDATVWAYSGYTSDHLDLYYAADATAPTWTFLTTLTPAGSGRQVLSATYTLPAGTLQAVRGNFRYGGSPGTCTGGGYDDRDDLVFATAVVAPDTTPPQVALSAPAEGATVGGCVALSAEATDDRGLWKVEFLVDGGVVATVTASPYTASWCVGVPFGSRAVSARATDLAGNVTDTTAVNVVAVDQNAPYVTLTDPPADWVVRGVRSVAVSTSDESAIAGVELYVDGMLVATAPAAPASFAWDTTAFADGVHRLQAKGTDALGNVGLSAVVRETVDNTPPQVAITSPAAGASIGPSLTVAASASDANANLSLYFFLGGRSLGYSFTAPFGGTWSTLGFAPGTYDLVAEAHDFAGNVSRSTVPVVIAPDTTPPTVTLVEPPPAAKPGAGLNLVAAAQDPYGVARVDFYVNGALYSSDTAAPWMVGWTAPSQGSATVSARAYDAAGNFAETPPLTVTADSVPPSVTLLAPGAGATLTGSVTLEAAATDDVLLSRVEFWADRFLLGVATSPPWQLTWDSSDLSNGSWSVVAKAIDVAGNVTTSTASPVTVTNATTAEYPSGNYAPRCWRSVGVSCNSGTALDGRAGLGPEAAGPGTLFQSCQDGTAGTYHGSPSVDRVRVRATADAWLKPGRPAAVDVTAWIGSLSDRVDLYVTTFAAQPSWVFVTTLTPSGTGRQVLTANLTLPSQQGEQAIRVNLRGQGTPATPCTTGSMDDHDDLSFMVSNDPVPPAAALSSPAAGSVVSGMVPLTCAASDNVGLNNVSFQVSGTTVGHTTSAPYQLAWNSATVANGVYALACTAVDTNGNGTTSTPVSVTVQNTSTGTQPFANGGFESGHVAWSESPGTIIDAGTATPARTGSWKAKSCGRGTSGTDLLWQQVAIPAAARQATLRFWLLIQTAEGTSYVYDKLKVTVRDPTGAVLETLTTLSNRDKSSAYVERVFDLSAYRGQTVRIHFEASEDSSLATTFLVDDVSLQAPL